ncbi:lysylphosphatidylglycerol synthase domain-containing protein [Angustibacter peucedani]
MLLLLAVPSASGATWSAVGHELHALDLPWLAALVAVWWAGLWAHSAVLTASLPGLSSRRAIGLNLAGSAIGNAVPLGGALSLGLTSTMVRSWGFAPGALGAFLTVSTACNLLARVAVGAAGLAWAAVALPGVTGARSVSWLTVVTVTLLGIGVLAAARERLAARCAASVARVVARVRPGRGRDPRAAAVAAVRLRRQVIRTVARSWHRLSLGMVGYLFLLAVLLWCSLRALGAPLPWTAVLAAVALERLVTAVPITPGGAGVAELVLTSCLALAGAAAADAAAAALVYRAFTFFLEIPLGLAVTGAWGWGRWRGRHLAGAAA